MATRVRVAQNTHLEFKVGDKFRIDGTYRADIDGEEMVVIHIPGYTPIAVEAFRVSIVEDNETKYYPHAFYR